MLLSVADGVAGTLALPPHFLLLYSADDIDELLEDEKQQKRYPGMISFGSNGGLERLAIDISKRGPPFPVVLFDPIGGIKPTVKIAPDFATL